MECIVITYVHISNNKSDKSDPRRIIRKQTYFKSYKSWGASYFSKYFGYGSQKKPYNGRLWESINKEYFLKIEGYEKVVHDIDTIEKLMNCVHRNDI